MQKYKDSILYIIFIVISIIFAGVKIQPKVVTLMDVETQLKTKNLEVVELDRKLEAIKAESAAKEAQSVEKSKKIYKSDEAGLDIESSFTVMFDDIIEMAKYNGIKIYAIEYVYDPSDDEVVKGAPGSYNVCQLNMQMIADYVDLEGFFKEIYKYPYLVNINNIEIVPYEKNKKLLLTKLQLKLYTAK